MPFAIETQNYAFGHTGTFSPAVRWWGPSFDPPVLVRGKTGWSQQIADREASKPDASFARMLEMGPRDGSQGNTSIARAILVHVLWMQDEDGQRVGIKICIGTDTGAYLNAYDGEAVLERSGALQRVRRDAGCIIDESLSGVVLGPLRSGLPAAVMLERSPLRSAPGRMR